QGELLAATVMPRQQTRSAVETCRELRARFPRVPIVWGGYFPSNYTQAALHADYVDFAVRGQGEDALLELIEAIRGGRALETIQRLSYKDGGSIQHHNPERSLKPPDGLTW